MTFEEKHNKGYQLLHEKDLDHALDAARELQKNESGCSRRVHLGGGGDAKTKSMVVQH